METHPELVRLLSGLNQTPGDDVLWLVVADWLEENDQPERGELVRLNHRLRDMPEGDERWAIEAHVRELINGGARPCVPEVVNSIGMRFALILPGTFGMGSRVDEAERQQDEGPRHLVEITRRFWMGTFPVTQRQYQAVTGQRPSSFRAGGARQAKVDGLDTGDYPVETVSWEDARKFCETLSALREEAQAGRAYRLPTEAEWEYCCRAGACSTTAFHFGPILDGTQANCDTNSPYPPGSEGKAARLTRTCAVGSYCHGMK